MKNLYYLQQQKYQIYSLQNIFLVLLGDFIKVYLYILFLSKYNKDVNINDLSKKLSIQYPVIQEALKYWETHQERNWLYI